MAGISQAGRGLGRKPKPLDEERGGGPILEMRANAVGPPAWLRRHEHQAQEKLEPSARSA